MQFLHSYKWAILFCFVLTRLNLYSQIDSEYNFDRIADSIYISETEEIKGRDKVLHAEPLYIDLIRDLGARKGEKEWNVGFGLIDNQEYDSYETLIEYEWAPIDRLGFEIELPFTFYYANKENGTGDVPSSKLNGLKLAAQWSFFVSEKISTSMAIGYLHEFELIPFSRYGKEKLYSGNIYNPFFVAAKRWGQNWHTLLYTGPQIGQHFGSESIHTNWQINSNLHYMIPGTRNFIGVELNKEFQSQDFDMTIRPQMRLGISDNLLIGIVVGIPVKREKERFSSFLRVIYEPGHKK